MYCRTKRVVEGLLKLVCVSMAIIDMYVVSKRTESSAVRPPVLH